ncbi:MAG: DNA-directed RNA polymerase subunit omega [Coriobacteriia bacterium]|nr:DNA-directed RNA polymerase subunit omega [Coriobacteriia bacterium]MCL2537530.1 DNA-directed RNA polymerase subunit omega [Coriobacteriia bacterium]
MSIVNPEIDQLLDKVDSKFTLCTLSAKRACQINDMVHGVREQALSAMATSEIAKLTSAKPLALAMDEIARGDVSPEAPLVTEEEKAVTPLRPQAETGALSAVNEGEDFAASLAQAAEVDSASAHDMLG